MAIEVQSPLSDAVQAKHRDVLCLTLLPYYETDASALGNERRKRDPCVITLYNFISRFMLRRFFSFFFFFLKTLLSLFYSIKVYLYIYKYKRNEIVLKT